MYRKMYRYRGNFLLYYSSRARINIMIDKFNSPSAIVDTKKKEKKEKFND